MGKFIWKDGGVVQRYAGNPIVGPENMPYPADMVYNPGVTKWQGRYAMVFRYIKWLEKWGKSTRGMGLAFSDDGLKWEVSERRCAYHAENGFHRRIQKEDFTFTGYDPHMPEDPRLIVVDKKLYMCFVDNTPRGLRGCVAVTKDLQNFEILSAALPDNRNLVLFPEKINGRLARLERPFRAYGRLGTECYDIWYSESPDGRFWGNSNLVLAHDAVPFCNLKNGPSGQPIKTDKGWLTIFHAAHEDPEAVYPTWRNENWHDLYCVGVMLLDLKNPSKLIGLSKEPLMVPTLPYKYEVDGYRSSTLFPCGIIPEADGTVRLYYGACDNLTCLATARIDDLLKLCKPV